VGPESGQSSKTWSYAYDKNNNMTSESFPRPAVALAGDYSNTMAYNALDRMTSQLVGKRSLTTTDEALFGSRTYTYSWDEGRNAVGKLTYARAYKPNALTTATTAVMTYLHDGQGNRIITRHELTLDGMAPIIREFTQSFTPHYGPRMTYFNDAFIATAPNTTWTQTVYDDRGMPSQLNLLRTGQPQQAIAGQTRNVAGLVTKRRTDQAVTTGAMPFIESNWTDDKLGRPTDQTVVKGATTVNPATAVVRQQLQYYGNSDPRQLVQTLGTAPATTLGFVYDTRHQLLNVNGGTAFTGVYAFNTAGRFNTAAIGPAIPLPSSDVKPRNVKYIYGTGGANVGTTQGLGAIIGVDKEAVAKLVTQPCVNLDQATCPSYAEYNYDDAGNQTKRKYIGTNETWDYLYDGEDNLRRVTKKIGATVSAIEEYWYDDAGARIAIIKRNSAGVKTELRWFIGGAEAHYSLSAATPAVATLIKVYSHASLGTPVARIERTSNAVNTIEYQFHGLGSNTIAAVSGEGVVNASFAYAPYGEVIESTDVGALPVNGLNGKDKHRRRVTDKYIDEASGLAYFGARYYDNILMGWTHGDPLYRFNPDTRYSAPRKSNLYMYVIGNPVRYLDPDGLGISDWLLARIGDVAVTAMYAGPAGSAATSMGASYNGVRENSHSTATWGQVAHGAKSSLYVVPYLGTALAAKDVVQADNNLDRAVAITALVLPKVISEAKGLVAESRAAAAEARTVAGEAATVGGGCFTGDMLVTLPSGAQIPISIVKLGRRVATQVVDESDLTDVASAASANAWSESPNPLTWRTIRLHLDNPDLPQSSIEISLLRPLTWIQANHVVKDTRVPVDLSEMGIVNAFATVDGVEPAPQIEAGSGRIVLRHTGGWPIILCRSVSRVSLRVRLCKPLHRIGFIQLTEVVGCRPWTCGLGSVCYETVTELILPSSSTRVGYQVPQLCSIFRLMWTIHFWHGAGRYP
jgi:RHS repeat-associated protein